MDTLKDIKKLITIIAYSIKSKPLSIMFKMAITDIIVTPESAVFVVKSKNFETKFNEATSYNDLCQAIEEAIANKKIIFSIDKPKSIAKATPEEREKAIKRIFKATLL